MTLTIKELIEKNAPGTIKSLQQIYTRIPKIGHGNNDINKEFNEIYKENYWNDNESVSGQGSNLPQTEEIRKLLPKIIEDYKVKTMIDIPCGDFYWMSKVNLEQLDNYIGADLVKELIEETNKKYGDNKREFIVLDLTKDKLPKVDLIFVRDCLVHLSYDLIFQSIEQMKKSGSKYLLTTTFPDRTINYDIVPGFWRPLNLELPPFNFPKPVKIINEKCTQNKGKYSDKSLALWKIDEI